MVQGRRRCTSSWQGGFAREACHRARIQVPETRAGIRVQEFAPTNCLYDHSSCTLYPDPGILKAEFITDMGGISLGDHVSIGQ